MSTIQDIIFSDKVRSSMPVIMSSRVRLARNLNNYKFPKYSNAAELDKIAEICKSVLVGCKTLKSPRIFEASKLGANEKLALVESHLCSPELARSGQGSCVLISNDRSIVLMINEEDHIRMQIFAPDLDFKQMWTTLSEVDDYIQTSIDIAYHDTYGFLTACPTNVGTGIRGSVMLHLPGLVLSGQLGVVANAVQKLGFAIRGIYGSGNNVLGGIFQLSNQYTLGMSEVDILSRLHQVAAAVFENEELARKWLMKNRRVDICDAIGRSFGLLLGSYSMCADEAINHLSNMRLAVDLGFLPVEYRAGIDRLISDSQPAHIRIVLGAAANDEECDVKRAEILRQFFCKLPVPQF